MADISTIWETTRGDWQLAGPQLANGNDIITAVLISLFTNRVANPDDVINDMSGDPRGWWGDVVQYPIGSRLWLIERAKKTQATLALAKGYIEEAIQWLLDDGVASRIDVFVEWTRAHTLGAQVTVYAPLDSKPIVKIGTQNVFALPGVQVWGWNADQGSGQWEPRLLPAPPSVWDAGTSSLIYGAQTAWVINGASASIAGFDNFSPYTPVNGVRLTLYGTQARSSGKRYFEIHITDTSSSDVDHIIGKLGLAKAGYPAGGHWPFYANGIGGEGGVFAEGEPLQNINVVVPPWANGSLVIVGIAVDFSTGNMWMSKAGSWGSANPSAGTLPAFSTVTGPVVPFVRYYALIMTATAVLHASVTGQIYAPPAGFTTWDS